MAGAVVKRGLEYFSPWSTGHVSQKLQLLTYPLNQGSGFQVKIHGSFKVHRLRLDLGFGKEVS